MAKDEPTSAQIESAVAGEKVRYPRLGSFEVFVVVQPGFAPKTSGLPDVLQVWSKLWLG